MLGPFFIILACALWATDTLIRYPLSSVMSATEIVFLEHFVLTMVYGLIFFKSLKSFKRPSIGDVLSFLIVGCFGSALGTLAFTRAFLFINPSIVIILQKFQPVVAVTLASWVLGEKVHKMFAIWALIALIGAVLVGLEDIIAVMSDNKSIYDLFLNENALSGLVLVAFSVFSWGSATVFGKRLLMRGYSSEHVMAGRFFLGLLTVAPFYFLSNTAYTYSVEIYSKISLMVLISGILAMSSYYLGLKRTSARVATLLEMTFPFMAVIVNWFFLDAKLGLVQIAGGLILFLGSFIIQIKKY